MAAALLVADTPAVGMLAAQQLHTLDLLSCTVLISWFASQLVTGTKAPRTGAAGRDSGAKEQAG